MEKNYEIMSMTKVFRVVNFDGKNTHRLADLIKEVFTYADGSMNPDDHAVLSEKLNGLLKHYQECEAKILAENP